MKYTAQIEIDLSLDRVIELFDNPENLRRWQQGLISFEHLSGEPGQPGARSKLVFQTGRHTIELIETVTVRNLPEQFDGAYDTKGMHNIVRNRFIDLGSDRTRWESENEFEFRGALKFTAWLMKGAFAKQSLKHMQDFKAFAEEGRDVNDAGA